MKNCIVCGVEFKSKAHNALTCSKECARENHRRNNRKGGKHYNPNRSHGYEAVKTFGEKLEETHTCTLDPWKNLMLGILVVAKDEGDEGYLEEFGELYQDALTPRLPELPKLVVYDEYTFEQLEYAQVEDTEGIQKLVDLVSGGIYGILVKRHIVVPHRCVYVGLTDTFERRWYQHQSSLEKGTHRINLLTNYTLEQLEFVILSHVATREEEIRLKKKYRPLVDGEDGLGLLDFKLSRNTG